jgi:hypothetical protein
MAKGSFGELAAEEAFVRDCGLKDGDVFGRVLHIDGEDFGEDFGDLQNMPFKTGLDFTDG